MRCATILNSDLHPPQSRSRWPSEVAPKWAEPDLSEVQPAALLNEIKRRKLYPRTLASQIGNYCVVIVISPMARLQSI